MKYNKRSGLYQASNVTFDPITKKSLSYNWWAFTLVIEGKLIFNDWQYSSTTRKHQCKVKALLASLGIKIDQVVYIKRSLSDFYGLEDLYEQSEECLCNKFLEQQLKKQEYYLKLKERKKAIQQAKKEFNLIGENQNELYI
jgi:hypothetical protein